MVTRVLSAAFAVFVLDGLYVVIVFAGILRLTTAERIFQGVARAILGSAAFAGGWRTAALGVVLHFFVALGWSTVWAVVYERSALLRVVVATTWRALFAGAAYGVIVWLLMHVFILQFTRAAPSALTAPTALLVLLAHVLVVGPPIVVLVRRRAPPAREPTSSER